MPTHSKPETKDKKKIKSDFPPVEMPSMTVEIDNEPVITDSTQEKDAPPDSPVLEALPPVDSPALDPFLAPTPAVSPGHLTPLNLSPEMNHSQLAGDLALGKSYRKLYFIGITIVLLASVSGLFYYLSQTVMPDQAPTFSPSASPLAALTPSPSTSPKPAGLTPNQITLEFLNATKTHGLAASTAAKFKAKGYTIAQTGNSPDDASTNQLYIQKSLEGQLDILMADVKTELNIASVSGYLSDTDSSARIVLGNSQ